MMRKTIIAIIMIVMILLLQAFSCAETGLLTFDSPTERETVYVMKEELVRSVISENDEIKMAKMLWGEDRANPMYMRAAIIWCVYNRMDAGHESIDNIINDTSFPGYRESHPVKDWAVSLIRDVTIRYVLELNGFTDVGRVLPKEYLFYEQPDGKYYHIFKTKLKYNDPSNKVWDWSLPSPYND